MALPFTGINDTGIPRDFVGDLLKSRLYVFSDPEFFTFCAWRFFQCPPLEAHTLDIHAVHSDEEVRFVTTRAATLLPIDFKLGSVENERGERQLLAMFTLELTGAPARYYALFLEYDQKTAPPQGLCDRAKLLEVPAPSFAAFLPDRVTYSAPEGAFSPRRHWPVEIAGMVNRCEQFARDLDPESWNATVGWVRWDEAHEGGEKTHFGHFRALGSFPRETIDWVPALTKPSVVSPPQSAPPQPRLMPYAPPPPSPLWNARAEPPRNDAHNFARRQLPGPVGDLQHHQPARLPGQAERPRADAG